MGGNIGYSNGFIPESMLVTFNQGWNATDGNWKHQLSPGTYAKHLKLVELARARKGRTLEITEGWGAYRPYDPQVLARRLYGNGAAYPGTSSHGGFWENQQTLAIDYGNWGWVYDWDRDAFYEDVRAAGLEPGLIHPSRGNNYPDEPWHVVDLDPWSPAPAPAGGKTVLNTILEDTMSNPIINVVAKVGDRTDSGTLWFGRDDGTFQKLTGYSRELASVMLGSIAVDGGSLPLIIPTVAERGGDFDKLKALWREMKQR